MANPAAKKPLLVFDGDCGFCRSWIMRWRQMTKETVDYAPYQQVVNQFPDISPDQFEHAVHLIEPDGTVSIGAEAVFRTLSEVPGKRWWLKAYQKIPGFAQISEFSYRIVADNRAAFSFLTNLLVGKTGMQPRYFLTRWIFLRLLAIIYLIAFFSWGIQQSGLIGTNGILPIDQYLESVQQQADNPYWQVPTLAWFNPGDGILAAISIGGMLVSISLLIGFAPGLSALLLWVGYLSLVSVGQRFMAFQWDSLLLEVGFLAIFFAPWKLFPRQAIQTTPSITVLWLFRWLLFRLTFASGFVKLASGDSVWKDASALNFHYQTQPLPNSVSWFVHQLPDFLHKLSVFGMFAIELLVPFLIFAPRRWRIWGGGILIGLQFTILLTGNYTYFNWLTIILCLLLFDDLAFRKFIPRFVVKWFQASGVYAISNLRQIVVVSVAIVILVSSSLVFTRQLTARVGFPQFINQALSLIAPLRSVNSYGLFAVMTTQRPEIILQGSNDGQAWQSYSFKWKPGDLKQRPKSIAPHQPRLDWQMWFAALQGNYQQVPWFSNFALRLLQGSPEVLALLDHNPFADNPPRFIRAVLYDYQFTSLAERRISNNWWQRTQLGLYMPAVSLKPE